MGADEIAGSPAVATPSKRSRLMRLLHPRSQVQLGPESESVGDQSANIHFNDGDDQKGKSSLRVRFRVRLAAAPGRKVHVVGSIPALGSWALQHARPLTHVRGDRWELEMALPAERIEYKYVAIDDTTADAQWENGVNRSVDLSSWEQITVSVSDEWAQDVLSAVTLEAESSVTASVPPTEPSGELLHLRAVSEDLRAQLARKDEELAAMRDEMSRADEGARERVTEELAALKTRCAELEDALSEAQADAEKERLAAEKAAKAAAEQAAAAAVAASASNTDKDALRAALEQLRARASSLRAEMESLRAEASEAPAAAVAAATQEHESALRDVAKFAAHLEQEAAEAASSHAREFRERRRLFDEVMRLKGNIRVFCRVRPPSESELRGATTVQTFADEPTKIEVCDSLSGNGNARARRFAFDRVFGPSASQTDVFEEARALMTSALDGYNVCIFAYGQTGSGKTHTMMGSAEDPGLNVRCIQELFRLTNERSHAGSASTTYSLDVSVLEIYNDDVRDLLTGERLEIRLERGTGRPHAPDMARERVASPADVHEVMARGSANRAVGATNCNERSSRSHSIVSVCLTGEDRATGETRRSTVYLVDLAGSERVGKSEATGSRLREAQHINKSLAALGDVVHALVAESPHIPYRNAKLTHLLQDALGGDSKTLMIVQVSPGMLDTTESVSSLQFAARASRVELRAKRHVDGGAGSAGAGGDAARLRTQLTRVQDELRMKTLEINHAKERAERESRTVKQRERDAEAVTKRLRDDLASARRALSEAEARAQAAARDMVPRETETALRREVAQLKEKLAGAKKRAAAAEVSTSARTGVESAPQRSSSVASSAREAVAQEPAPPVTTTAAFTESDAEAPSECSAVETPRRGLRRKASNQTDDCNLAAAALAKKRRVRFETPPRVTRATKTLVNDENDENSPDVSREERLRRWREERRDRRPASAPAGTGMSLLGRGTRSSNLRMPAKRVAMRQRRSGTASLR